MSPPPHLSDGSPGHGVEQGESPAGLPGALVQEHLVLHTRIPHHTTIISISVVSMNASLVPCPSVCLAKTICS